MIVGNKGCFGIEFELDAGRLADPELRDWKYGHIRWWCGGEEVGRYEADTTIRDVSIEAERFLTYKGKRQDSYLMDASGEDVIRTLVRALYEDHGQSDEQVEANDERYRRFVVKPLVDVFDSWDIFLVESETIARLLWRRVKNWEVRECELASGEFDAVLRRFIDALAEATEDSHSLRLP